MVTYMRSIQMISGSGFKCPSCNKETKVMATSKYDINLKCSKCNITIDVHVNEPIPWFNPKSDKEGKVEQPLPAN